MAGEQEEGLDRVLVVDRGIFDSVHLMQEGMLGTCGGVVQAARVGVDRGRISVFVGQHDGLEAVHDALGAVGDGGRVVAQLGPPAQGLDADQLDGVRQEGREHADGVGASAHTGRDLVRQVAGLGPELVPGLLADAELEIADHEGEGMGACGRADAVDRVLVFFSIGHKGGVHGLLEGLEAEADRDHVGSEQLHAGHVGRLLGDVDLAHIDVALESEIGRSRGQGDAVLACSRLGDDLLFAHVLGQKPLAHAVVELVGPGVVEVLPLEIDLGPAQEIGQVLAVVDRRRPALKITADAAQFRDELGGLGDGVVGLRVFVEGLDQLGVLQIIAAVFSEVPVLGGVFLQIVIKVAIFIHGVLPF